MPVSSSVSPIRNQSAVQSGAKYYQKLKPGLMVLAAKNPAKQQKLSKEAAAQQNLKLDSTAYLAGCAILA